MAGDGEVPSLIGLGSRLKFRYGSCVTSVAGPNGRRREVRPGFIRNVRTLPAMPRKKAQAASTASLEGLQLQPLSSGGRHGVFLLAT